MIVLIRFHALSFLALIIIVSFSAISIQKNEAGIGCFTHGWADVFIYPWITREQLAQIVHRFKERAFAEKLQKFLHDPKCGKHLLRNLQIDSKPKMNLKRKIEVFYNIKKLN